PETAAHVDVTDLKTQLAQLGVVTGGFPNGFFYRDDVGDLGTDMKMDQLEAVGQIAGFEKLGGLQQIRRGKAELRFFPSGERPLAGTLGLEPDADADA